MITKGENSTEMLYSNLAPDTDWKKTPNTEKKEKKTFDRAEESSKEQNRIKREKGEKLKVEQQRKLKTFQAQRKRVKRCSPKDQVEEWALCKGGERVWFILSWF
jgi:hypothetical protein